MSSISRHPVWPSASLHSMAMKTQQVTVPDNHGIPRTLAASDYQVRVIRSILTGQPMYASGKCFRHNFPHIHCPFCPKNVNDVQYPDFKILTFRHKRTTNVDGKLALRILTIQQCIFIWISTTIKCTNAKVNGFLSSIRHILLSSVLLNSLLLFTKCL